MGWRVDDVGQGRRVPSRGDSLSTDFRIRGSALHCSASGRGNHCQHFFGIRFLTVARARRTRDAFIHQGAAEIICARREAGDHALMSHLDPRGLDVRDHGIERQTGHRVHQDGFPKSRPLACATFQIQRRFHVHKRQRDELGKAAGFQLLGTNAQ